MVSDDMLPLRQWVRARPSDTRTPLCHGRTIPQWLVVPTSCSGVAVPVFPVRASAEMPVLPKPAHPFCSQRARVPTMRRIRGPSGCGSSELATKGPVYQRAHGPGGCGDAGAGQQCGSRGGSARGRATRPSVPGSNPGGPISFTPIPPTAPAEDPRPAVPRHYRDARRGSSPPPEWPRSDPWPR